MATEKEIWNDIRSEYITTNTSYRKLAEKYGISETSVANHGKKEKWAEKRRKHKQKIVDKTTNKLANKEAAKLAKLAKAADKLTDVINKTLADTQQFNRYLVTESTYDAELKQSTTTLEEKIYKKVDTKAVKELTASLKDLVTVIRNVNDIPTIREKAAMDIAAERLNMDKQKADMGNNKEDVKVILSDEVKEYGV